MQKKNFNLWRCLKTQLGLFVFLTLTILHTACPPALTGKDYSSDEETTDGTDGSETGEVSTEACDDSPALHPSYEGFTDLRGVVDLAKILCVTKASDSLITTSGYCSSTTTFATIAEAVAYREANFSSADQIAIFLAEDTTYDESLSLSSAQDSNTSFIGCAKTATLAAAETGATVTTHAMTIDDDAETVSFYNLTFQGLKDDYTASAADYVDAGSGVPVESAATVLVDGATGFTFENVTFDQNYYQALLIQGTNTSGTLSQVEFASVEAPSDADAVAAEYNSSIAVWYGDSANDLIVSEIVFTDNYSIGFVVDGANSLTLDDSAIENTQVTGIHLDHGAMALIGSSGAVTFDNNNVSIFAADLNSLSLQNSSVFATNTNDALISCDTGSAIGSTNYLNSNEFDMPLWFGEVNVSGSGNILTGFSFTASTTLGSQFALAAASMSPVADITCSRNNF